MDVTLTASQTRGFTGTIAAMSSISKCLRRSAAVTLPAFLLIVSICAKADMTALVAGGGKFGDGSPATVARLDKPFAVTFDSGGNLYIGEYGGCRVLKVDSAGVLTTLAGTGENGFAGDGGPGTHAQFSHIHDIVTGPDGALYVADSSNRRVRRIDLATGIVSTFAGTGGGKNSTGDGGAADRAVLDGVASLFFDPFGKTLLLSGFSKSVRVIDMQTKIITTLKGAPGGRSIAIDSKGNLYVANGQTLGVHPPKGGFRILLDKTHTGGAALPLGDNPKHLAIDGRDNVWICDEQHSLIREYLPDTGKLLTIAGDGKPGHAGLGDTPDHLELNRPHGIYFHTPTGVMYIADSFNDRVLRIDP
jgi:DNA-binding beta-propeller fold protein YncE